MESGLDKEEFLAQEAERKRKAEEKRAASAAADGGPSSAANASAPEESGKGDGGPTGGGKRGLSEGSSKAAKKAKTAQVEATADAGGASAELKDKFGKLLKAVSSTQRLARKVAHLFLQLPRPEDAPGKPSISRLAALLSPMRVSVVVSEMTLGEHFPMVPVQVILTLSRTQSRSLRCENASGKQTSFFMLALCVLPHLATCSERHPPSFLLAIVCTQNRRLLVNY